MGVKEKALQAIRQECMLSSDCVVVAGVSGGADSVTLLHLLLTLRNEGVLSDVVAVHVNHLLRGEESERDQRFVEDLCHRWNVKLHVERHDVALLASQRKCGVEEIGREWRYTAFEKVASTYHSYRIATAHTADDNAETLLLHLCRGSGLHGAAGIPPMRDAIIRPLITCTRDEIEQYCIDHQLSYVTDSTNTDTAYARNRIRHEVMPQLRFINPQATTAIARFIEQARKADAFLEALADEAAARAKQHDDVYSRQTLLSLSEPIRSRTLYHIVKTAEERHIRLLNSLLEDGAGALMLPSGIRWCVTENELSMKSADQNDACPDFCFPIAVGESCKIGEKQYRLVSLSREEYEQKLNICRNRFANAMDCGKINGALFLRQRRNGDSFHPAGRNCGKTLKKLFNEQKTVLRDMVPILCDEQGIVLVVGYGCDERVCVTAETKTVLCVIKEEEVFDGNASGC